MALLTHGKDKRAETTRRLQFALSSANQTQNTTEIQSGILRTLNDFQRNKISHYIRKMFLWKQSWGEDFFFLCRKWQHLKLFQATEIFLLKQRGITALMGAQNPVQLLGRSNSRSSNNPQVLQSFTGGHLGTPTCLTRHLMESAQGRIWGFFLQISRKSSKNTPSAATGKTRRQMGWSSNQRNSLLCGLNCSSTTLVAKMSSGVAWKSKFLSIYLSAR